MEKISACLVVYNEEKLIRLCLESLRDVVDEIILVHDGECHDKTLEIAKEYGAKIFIESHIGEAEEHRPFSYKQSTGDWILQIDADEFLSEELRNNLSKLVADKEIDAYEILWPIWNGKKEIEGNWPYKRCLFRKSKASFLGIEQFVVEIKGSIKKVNYKLNHKPDYNNFSYITFINKQLPTARLQAMHYLKDFSEIEKYNWQGNEWPKKIILRRKYPLLLIPLEFLVTVFKNLSSGAYKIGLLGFKVSFIIGFYRVAVNYYIYKLKK